MPYDAYVKSARPRCSAFSWQRAIRNEHHTIAGLITGIALLALKLVA